MPALCRREWEINSLQRRELPFAFGRLHGPPESSGARIRDMIVRFCDTAGLRKRPPACYGDAVLSLDCFQLGCVISNLFIL